MKSYQRLSWIAFAAIFASALIFYSSCSGREETSTAATGPIEIEMWTHDALYIQFFQQRVAALNAANPDREIVLVTQEMPDPVISFISAAIARENLPDMIGIEQGSFPLLMEDDAVNQLLVDLRPRIGNRFSDFVEARWALYTSGDSVFGVESALTASVYYYQPALFEAASVSVPQTWNEFIEAGRVLGDQGVALTVMNDSADALFSMMFMQRGGEFFDANGDFVLDSSENRQRAMDTLQVLRELEDSNALFTVYGGEFWGSAIPTAFSEGRLAGIIMPDWYNTCCLQPAVSDMAGQWRVAPMPLWDDGQGFRTTVWGGTGFGITQASQHQDIVWEIIEDGYMTLDGQLDRYNTIAFFPTLFDALDHPEIQGIEDPFFGGQRIGEVFADVALETPPLWQSPARPQFREALSTHIVPFIEGEITAAQFIDRVVTQTRREAGL